MSSNLPKQFSRPYKQSGSEDLSQSDDPTLQSQGGMGSGTGSGYTGEDTFQQGGMGMGMGSGGDTYTSSTGTGMDTSQQTGMGGMDTSASKGSQTGRSTEETGEEWVRRASQEGRHPYAFTSGQLDHPED